MIPKKEEIIQLAEQLYFEDCYKRGCQNPNSPEPSELLENGYYNQALSQLMRNQESRYQEWREKENFAENREVEDLSFNVNEALNTGFFVCGTSQSGKTNLAKWLVRALLDSGIVVYVLDTSQAWTHDTPISNCIRIVSKTVEWKGSTVFDLSALEARDKIAFVNSLCKAVYERHVEGYSVREFIVFEEAQNYLPNGCLRLATRRKSICESVLDIITVGANYGIRFGVLTQFPALIDKTPIKISMQRYFGWTWEKNDVAYLKGFLGKDWIQQLQSLQRGEFIYQFRNETHKIATKPFELEKPKISTNNFKWSFNCQLK
jgi:hypothetical protein